ncbi:hypothetical protein P3S68_007662 [Capsicum galapagoense]
MDIMETTTPQELNYNLASISLTSEDKDKIYKPWDFSLFIKLNGKKVAHNYLRTKLINLWRPTETLTLIDLGYDYFTVKFIKEENMITALHQGPWFVNGFYLSIRRWHPNFAPSEARETFTALWIRLPELPTEYYDHIILSKIGSKIGKNAQSTKAITGEKMADMLTTVDTWKTVTFQRRRKQTKNQLYKRSDIPGSSHQTLTEISDNNSNPGISVKLFRADTASTSARSSNLYDTSLLYSYYGTKSQPTFVDGNVPSRADHSDPDADGARRDNAPHPKSDKLCYSRVGCNEKGNGNIQSPSMDVNGSSTTDELSTPSHSLLQHPRLGDSNDGSHVAIKPDGNTIYTTIDTKLQGL